MSRLTVIAFVLLLPLASCGDTSAARSGSTSPGGAEPPGKLAIVPATAMEAPPPAAQTPSLSEAGAPSSPVLPETPTVPEEGLPPGTLQSQNTSSRENPPATTGRIAGSRSPVARTPMSALPIVQAARSLAGPDRFLVARPLSEIQAADFELGSLYDKLSDPSLSSSLDGLVRGLTTKKLKDAAFSSQGLRLAELLYSPELEAAPTITRVRFSRSSPIPGSTQALNFRLFSASGAGSGFAIFGMDEQGNWQIEHLDLDLQGLRDRPIRSSPWDPYGYSRNLLD